MPNLVGTGLNQVPTNSMLGGLAYQDPEHASIKNLDLKNLSQINSEIAGTAVDVFVYDTSKDSDGGAWRKRTQSTSWYNETLGTTTRGTRKEFPSVAVIVATSSGVIIYDGDDPDLPMWMIFEDSISDMINTHNVSPSTFSLSAKNGSVLVGSRHPSYGEANVINFISDSGVSYYSAHSGDYKGNISQRNDGLSQTINSNYGTLVNSVVNDVAMTVLPNAPIDDATGLPIPTIAVATDNGVSVIKDDGIVVDYTYQVATNKGSDDVYLSKTGRLQYSTRSSSGGQIYYVEYDQLSSSDVSSAPNVVLCVSQTGGSGITRILPKGHIRSSAITNEFTALGLHPNTYTNYQGGLFLHKTTGDVKETDGASLPNDNFMGVHIHSDYNTGWMHGDIKGAFLSDTDDTNLSGYLYDDDMQNDDTSDWSDTFADTFAYITSPLTAYQLTRSAGDARTRRNLVGSISSGTKIIVTYEAYASSGTPTIKYGMTSGSYDQSALTAVSINTNWNPISFEATFGTTGSANHTYVTLWNTTPGATVYYRNFKVRVVEEDRSVNNKSLTYFGTVTKTPVATGAELVGYSGFTNSNYLKQPYNSNMDFGTGDFSVTWWQYTTGNISNSEYVYDRQGGNGNRHAIYYTSGNNGSMSFYTNDSGATSEIYAENINNYKDQWTCYTATRDSSGAGNLTIFINGKIGFRSSASSVRNMSNSNAELFIGIRHSVNTGAATQAKFALMRFSKSVPSAEQIKKIYEDEKCLFHENAKATLYGSSDAVTALAFDDTTNLLHVGTSAGRSEFQGLSRINNTTDAVTTAISASNGLVAEQ